MNNGDEKLEWPWGFVPPEEAQPQPEPQKEETRGAPKGEGHVYPKDEDVKTGNSYLRRKAEAKALYISGYSLKTISITLGDVPSSVINKWAEDEQWKPEREVYMSQTTKDRLEQIEAGHDISIKHLQQIKDVAIGAIQDKTAKPKKFSEATSSYIQAEEMQRKIKIEAVQIHFLQEVAKVLREEITDQDLLRRIGEKLSKLYHQEQLRSIEDSKLLAQAREPEEGDDAPREE